MAYRAGFPIDSLSISGGKASQNGIGCYWKSLRGCYANDDKLIRRAFAFVHIGTIVDRGSDQPVSEDLRKEVLADMASALEARQTTVLWSLAPSVTDTDPFAHGGYKLASRLLKKDGALIAGLAEELCLAGAMSGKQVHSWLDAHADPLDLSDLERSATF